MNWKMFWTGVAFFLAGFVLALIGQSMVDQAVQQSTVELLQEALTAMVSAVPKALNADTTGERLEGLGSVLAWLGIALILLAVGKAILQKGRGG